MSGDIFAPQYALTAWCSVKEKHTCTFVDSAAASLQLSVLAPVRHEWLHICNSVRKAALFYKDPQKNALGPFSPCHRYEATWSTDGRTAQQVAGISLLICYGGYVCLRSERTTRSLQIHSLRFCIPTVRAKFYGSGGKIMKYCVEAAADVALPGKNSSVL
jgi:hypothetical protein